MDLAHSATQLCPEHAGTVGRKRKAAEPADDGAVSKATIPRQRPRKSAAPAPAAESRPASASRPGRAVQRGRGSDAEISSSSDDDDGDEAPSTGRRRGQPRGRGRGHSAAVGVSDTDATRSDDTAEGTEGCSSRRGRGHGRGPRGRGRGQGRASSSQGAAAAAANSTPAAAASGYVVPAGFDAGLLSGADFADKKAATRTVPEVFFRRWRTLRTEVSAVLPKTRAYWRSDTSAVRTAPTFARGCQEHATCQVVDSMKSCG